MRIILFTAFLILSWFGFNQTPIPNSVAVTQNFDGMNATTTLPSNWKMHVNSSSPTWAAASTSVTQQASSGAPTAGGTYNWGTSLSERSVGAMTSGSFANPNNLLAFFSNTHLTDNITEITIAYNAERFRVNTSAASIQFYYSLNGSTWAAVSVGDIATTSFPTGASSYTFGSPLTINKSGILITGLNIAPSSTFYLRWNFNTTGGSSQGIGIDNFSLVATHSPVALSPELNLQTSATSRACSYTHNFGSISTSNSSSVPLTIQNTGTADLTITSLALSGSADYTITAPPATPFTIAAGGGSQVITVNFNPSSGGTITGALTIGSNDSDEGTCVFNLTGIGVVPAPELNLQTSATSRACGYTHNFGSISTSNSSSVPLTIQNTGTADLTITSLALSGSADYTLSAPPATPFTIAAGASQIITVNFSPSSGGAITGALTIGSNDSDEGTCVFNLTGIGVVPAPELNLQTSATSRVCGYTHNFGSISTSNSSSVPLTIQNTGTADLTITSLALSGSADYTLSAPPATPFTIAAGASQIITVNFSPSSGGAITGALTIGSNDSDEGTCVFNLTGIGVLPCSELFFSEYVEGSSNNKYIEIYNPTSTSIDLSNYQVRMYANGSVPVSNTLTLSGSIAPYGVIVIANSSATIFSGTVDFTNAGVMTFNGDDALELVNTSTATTVDIIGTKGEDPGTGWTSGGHSTLDRTLVRNPTVSAGILVNPGSGFPTLTSEWTALSQDDVSNLGIHTSTSCASTNTITSGAITGSPFTVDCSTDDTGFIAFTSSGTFNGGNIYTAELSNAAGSFAAPVSIGTLSSTANTGSINITIPAATSTGTGYLIRITASDPATFGTSSAPFTINLTGGPCTLEPPHLTSVIINSCDGLCSEGDNEIVFGTSGDYSFNVNTTNFDFLYGATFPGTNYTDALVNNTTRINELNTAAGCGSLFVDANGGNVPANANWMLASTNICEEALTWSGLCGLGPIYVIFQNDGDWSSLGNFANNPSAPGTRFYRTSITSTLGSTFTIDYTTIGSYPNSDGVYASFDADGGAATAYGDDNCVLQPVLLPTGLLTYNGEVINGQSLLTWQTNSEQNNDYFTIAHSTTGYDFEVLGQVQGAGNSSTLSDYDLIHSRPAQGINYYKLTSTDFDGTTYTKGIVSLLFNSNGCYFDAQTSEIKFNERSDYRIFSMDGKLLGEVMNESSLLFNQQGIVLIQDLRTGLTERLFVP